MQLALFSIVGSCLHWLESNANENNTYLFYHYKTIVEVVVIIVVDLL